jgi:3-mercaptopyruvate sulfurtransferase SseA
MDRGFSRVRPLEGGLAAWVDAGLPTDEETLVSIGGTAR